MTLELREDDDEGLATRAPRVAHPPVEYGPRRELKSCSEWDEVERVEAGACLERQSQRQRN